MKEKTSVTLSADVLTQVDRASGRRISRSAFIEKVLRAYFLERAQRKVHARDLELINAAADELNAEAEDVQRYQANFR